jgi:hypothetical protein
MWRKLIRLMAEDRMDAWDWLGRTERDDDDPVQALWKMMLVSESLLATPCQPEVPGN